MSKNFVLKPVLMILALAITISTVFSFNVSANTVNTVEEVPEVDPEIQKETEKGLELSPYISSNNDGTINFNSQEAIANGIDETLVEESTEVYTKANEIIISENPEIETKANQIQTYAAKSGCSGSNYLDGNIFTGTLYINSCNVNSIIAVLAAGGGTAQLAHFIPVAGTYIAVAAGVLSGLGTGLLTYNNRAGNGVAIKLARNPITKKVYPYWITSQ